MEACCSFGILLDWYPSLSILALRHMQGNQGETLQPWLVLRSVLCFPCTRTNTVKGGRVCHPPSFSLKTKVNRAARTKTILSRLDSFTPRTKKYMRNVELSMILSMRKDLAREFSRRAQVQNMPSMETTTLRYFPHLGGGSYQTCYRIPKSLMHAFVEWHREKTTQAWDLPIAHGAASMFLRPKSKRYITH
jgi:hypothetical protein